MVEVVGLDREKAKAVRPLRALAPFIRPYRRLAYGALAALIATAMLSLALPLAVRRVVDGFGVEDLALMDEYFGAAMGIAALLALGTAARFYLVTRLGERVVFDIRKAVYARVIGMSPGFYERLMTGEVLSRLTTDTTVILSVIGSSVSIALRNLLTLAGGLGLLFWTSPKLTVLVLVGVPLVVLPILALGRRLRALSRESQDRIAEGSAQASETLLAAQTVQAYTHEAASRARYDRIAEAGFDAARRRIVARSVLTAIVIFLVFASVVSVLWIGARDVREGAMSPGELVQFVIYAVMVAGSAGALSEIWSELLRAAGATERIVDLLETADTIHDPAQPAAIGRARGEIAFEGVTFRYPARPETAALTGLDFRVRAGETVALVGPSGAGKTTIFQLLLRFFDPDEGRVTLDGTDIRDFARSDLRRQLALVPQEPVIFATTARENIRFGRPDATDAEIEAAARAAAAHDFLARLPEGYDTYVGERGVMLSGGQRQRIAIARAILRDAPVLLLDEATSALDAESERAVQAAVDRLAEGRTTLIIAHRLATVKRADRILVFEEGRIVAEGAHGALVAEGGLYARLARLQFTDGAA